MYVLWLPSVTLLASKPLVSSEEAVAVLPNARLRFWANSVLLPASRQNSSKLMRWSKEVFIKVVKSGEVSIKIMQKITAFVLFLPPLADYPPKLTTSLSAYFSKPSKNSHSSLHQTTTLLLVRQLATTTHALTNQPL